MVQAAKAGPDYIDPGFHAAATGRPSFNLDSWAMPPSLIDALVAGNAAHADLLVIEGAMGLFDGVPRPAAQDRGVGRSRRAARSAGGAGHRRRAGNRNRRRPWCAASPLTNVTCGSRGGAEPRRQRAACAAGGDAIAALDIPVLGAIPRDASLALPERHLGLVQAGEHANLAARLEHLADMAEHHLDIDAIKQLAVPPHRSAARLDAPVPPPGRRIALAQDDAFSFVYPHVLDGWRSAGAEIVPFSPLADAAPPEECDSCWLPGGYPELYAGALAAADRFPCRLDAVCRDAAGAWRVRRLHGARRKPRGRRGVSHRMPGLLGHATSFAHRKLHLGYRQARLLSDSPLGKPGTLLRGHEFHYAALTSPGQDEPLAELADSQGEKLGAVGGRRGNVTGTFFHAIAKV